jgi:hypothetical protein
MSAHPDEETQLTNLLSGSDVVYAKFSVSLTLERNIGATPNCFTIVAEDSLAREAFVNKIKLFYGNQNYAIFSASAPIHAAPRHVLFPYWTGLCVFI